jgi:formate/nitrite transporter FocA (FNT family)
MLIWRSNAVLKAAEHGVKNQLDKMSITMILSKIIAFAMIYIGYWYINKRKIAEYEGPLDKVTRWSPGIMFILGGIVILLFNADIFNLPPG